MKLKINLNFLKKTKQLTKDSHIINPNLYWQIIVYVCLVLVFIFFAFGFFLFKDVSSEPAKESSNFETKSEKIKKDRIKAVLDLYTERAKRAQSILNSTVVPADPSVPVGLETE